jgi:cell division septum initiation protein DivIVA
MKKTFKILGICLMVILILMVVLPFAFKGKIKGLVLKEANKNLNAKLEIGNISLSFIKNFPNAYVGLSDLVMIGKGEFEGDTLANIKSFSLSTSILDLINGSPYEIRKIAINGADIRLKVLADGQANWDITKSSGSEIPEEAPVSGTNNFRLLLKSLMIENSRLVYDDVPNSTYVILEGLNHHLSGDLGANISLLKTQTNIAKTLVSYDGLTYLKNATIDWKADIDADLEHNLYTFRENTLKINDFSVNFNGSVGLPDDGYDLQLSFTSPENTFKQLLSLIPAVYAQDFSAVKTDGKLSFDGFVKGKYTDDQYPAFKLNLGVTDAWFQYPDLPASVNDINMIARIESPGGDPDNTVIDVEKFSMNLAGNPIEARLLLKNPVSDPYIDTRVNVKLNLSDVKKFYPMEQGEELSGNITADFMLKGRLSDVENERYNNFEASGTFQTNGIQYSSPYFGQELLIESAQLNITPAYLDLTGMKIRAGRSDFNLKGKLDNYLAYYLKDETLQGNFSLNSSLIDANELLTFPESQDTPAAADTSALSAFIVPAGIDFTLNTSATSVEYMSLDIKNFNGKIRIKDQKLLLEDVSMNSLGGRLQISGSYESLNPLNPVIDFSLNIKDISIRETFKSFIMVQKFAPVAEKVLGDFSGNIKLAGMLDNQMVPRLESFSGASDLITSAIQVTNVNTLNQLSNSLKMDQLKELKISGMKVLVQFLNGTMDVKPFDFKALGIDMNLGGKTSLDQSIGYLLKMKIPRSMMGGAANNVMNDLVARAGQSGANITLGDYVNVDALIDGTLTDPKVKLNLAGTGKDLVESVKEQVQQQVEQKVEEVKDQAKEEADKYIQEANQKAQAILDEAQKQSEEVLKSAQSLADETKKQANANADKIVKDAKGKGYVSEMAAKKSAEEVRKQGDKQAQNILDEAKKKSDSILDKARLESQKIKEEARKKTGQ